MPNPKAPRVRRTIPSEPTGLMLPVDRLRQVGADDDLIAYWQEVFEFLPHTERRDLIVSWRRLSDDALAAEIDVEQYEGPPDALLGVPDGAASGSEGLRESRETGSEPVEGVLGVTLDEVPRGKVDDVLGWVRAAEDPGLRRARARAALDVEAERTDAEGKPAKRVSITDALREVAGG